MTSEKKYELTDDTITISGGATAMSLLSKLDRRRAAC